MEAKVLIKINENDEITDITSSVFAKNIEEYIHIDSGTGDKYANAQGNYLAKSIIDFVGRYNYKYQDGAILQVEHEDLLVEE